jgi:hypothetical protein
MNAYPPAGGLLRSARRPARVSLRVLFTFLLFNYTANPCDTMAMR